MTQRNLWGYIEGDTTVFPVEIDIEESVGDFKQEIKKKKAKYLENIDAAKLDVYKLGGDQGIMREEIKVSKCYCSGILSLQW